MQLLELNPSKIVIAAKVAGKKSFELASVTLKAQ